MDRHDLDKLKTLVTEMDRLVGDLRDTVEAIVEASEKIQDLLSDTFVMFPSRDMRLIKDMARDLNNLRFVQKIKRHLPALQDRIARQENEDQDIAEIIDDIQ